MAWVYLPESVASSLDSTEPSPDTELSATSSGTPLLRPLSWRGWKTRPWIRLLSGMTFLPSTADRGVASWISSLAASRAKTSASPESERDSKGNGRDSGPSTLGSFATYSPATSSWKTSQLSLLGDSTVSSETWPKSGSVRSNTMYSRPKRQARRTDVRGSSYSRNEYPTPSATPYGTSQNEGKVAHKRPTAGTPSLETWAKNWHTPVAGDARGAGPDQHTQSLGKDVKNWATPTAHDGRRPGADLHSTQGNNLSRDTANWATPRANDARDTDQSLGRRDGNADNLTGQIRRTWATPTAGDAKASGSRNAPGSAAHQGTTLTDQIRTGDSAGRRDRPTSKDGSDTSQRAVLNPRFVEALMGLPIGWTLPIGPTDSDALGMESSPRSPNSHGANSTPASPPNRTEGSE